MTRIASVVRRIAAVAVVTAVTAALVSVVGAGSASAASSCHPYPDVTASNSACENIAWLKGKAITKPVDGRYHPLASVTRGAMTAFLFRLTHPGAPAPRCSSKPFRDVSTTSTFCGYITWAKKNYLTFGYSDGSFGPGKPVTRGAMAAYLYRIADPGVGATKCAAKPFSDVPTSSQFCGVITWMVRNHITYGVGDGKYGTTLPVTRQAMASFLRRVNDGPLALMGRYFTGYHIFNMMGSSGNTYGVWFLDNKWAYWGRPAKGMPTCTKVTTKVVPGMQPNAVEGCVTYRLDAASGKLRISGATGTYTARDGLYINGYGYTYNYIAKPGARYAVNLTSAGYAGMCPSACSTWNVGLVLTKDGHFVLTSYSIGSGWTPGVGGGWAGSFPPDQHGTYRVGSRGRITLSFADGSTSTLTFAVKYGDNGKPDAAGKSGWGGVILGAEDFTPDV